MITKLVGLMKMNKKSLFNTDTEISLRVLIILEEIYPRSFDVEMINYFDYFILHTKDIGGEQSIHPELPNRFGELSIKRNLIKSGLKLLLSKGLIDVKYTDEGIEYSASEHASPFLDNLNTPYINKLTANMKWVCHKFKDLSFDEIKEFVSKNKSKWGSEASIIQGLL